jgi:hypothetical protein
VPEPYPTSKLSRREFARRTLWTTAGAVGLVSGLAVTGARPGRAEALPTETTALLDRSGFVYVSPLRSNGEESRCHAELWFGWIDGAVVVTVAADRWKARAIAGGLDRARIWVGDHGRWKSWTGRLNEAFRAAPHFDARGERVKDDALLERLLELYERKYPAEIGRWREPMRTGNADGSRVLLRYVPL